MSVAVRKPRPYATAWFQTRVNGQPHGCGRHNLRTNSGADWQAQAMGGGTFTAGNTGTATTAPTATTATLDGAGAPGSTTKWNGQLVTMGATYGVILSNTNASPPVLTIDKWYDPTNPTGAAASTPAAGRWIITPGAAPIFWMALTTDSAAAAATDTTLASELATNGLSRAGGTYSHSAGATSWAITHTFTCTGGSQTINKEAIFAASSGGFMPFESAEPSPPLLISSDTLAQTVTIND